MIVLVDLDNVLINTGEAWVGVLNERHGTNMEYSDITDWEIAKFFPELTCDEVFAPLSDGSVWSRVSPVPGARDAIEKLIADGDDVYVVTSSSLNTIGKKWKDVLQKFFPMIRHSHVIVSERKQMIMGDVLIDDAPFNLEGGNYYGILVDAPHNINYDCDGISIVRAQNWDCIYDLTCTLRQLLEGGENDG